ncbi:MAG: polysaccharide deacetylase family protein [Gammaproteobacteria bacterium]|nr:polysaccharide deacetylase family protein [Gammaproteobacteria bacterium]
MKSGLTFVLLFLLILPLQAEEVVPHGVVLMYHRFEENRYPSTNIRMAQFRAQLDYLQQEGFTFWPLRRMLDAIFNGHEIPDRTVALTVDDAYLSVYQQAYPLLKERKLPLTVFVSTTAIDQDHGGYMSWQQMREMQQHNIDFANHSASHLHLTRRMDGEGKCQWLERVRQDIEQARQRLQQELGPQRLPLFAYPFGEYNGDIAKLLNKMGYLALGQHSGAIGPGSDKQALPRFPINERLAALDSFAVKASALPLLLALHHPEEPELAAENPPRLTLELEPNAPLSAGQITCYLGDGTRLESKEKSKRSLTVQASEPLPPGRSRYNCTAAANGGRFYWFSQPWFNGPDPADPAY